jgi:hypothetical protein
MNCVDSGSRLIGVAAIAALPAVTRNFLAEGWWKLSVKLMSQYYENLLHFLVSTYRSHDLLRRRAVLRYNIWMTFENVLPFFTIVTWVNLNFLTHWGRGHLNCLNARSRDFNNFNTLNAELNPICYLLAL